VFPLQTETGVVGAEVGSGFIVTATFAVLTHELFVTVTVKFSVPEVAVAVYLGLAMFVALNVPFTGADHEMVEPDSGFACSSTDNPLQTVTGVTGVTEGRALTITGYVAVPGPQASLC